MLEIFPNHTQNTHTMEETKARIAELKLAMEIEEKNNFPNGNLWNTMADELYELERIPSIFETLSMILNSPKEY